MVLDQAQLGLAGDLVDQVVVVLGRDVEAVALLRVERGCVEHHGDLAFKDDKDLGRGEGFFIRKSSQSVNIFAILKIEMEYTYHGVFICTTHSLGGVSLDPEE